ncbi:MAG: hypothetical protein BWX88_00566 [Planctomycetes bacterium ADurb.Bin126]|nr:MAG: hypothetical protein BWX88_00566 [Planctomycetes bacterium ADurb.Bin126]HOD82124.1 hypothetical protein [Phycisphaerae bacterium]HQL72298.1 hypothetical protein [Phycisphaerae bacterium]
MKFRHVILATVVGLLPVSFWAGGEQIVLRPSSSPTSSPARHAAEPGGTARPAPDAPAAEGDSVVRKSNQASKRGCGSAAWLRGKVHLCNLFVYDRHSRWSDEERRSVVQRMDDAVRFLVGEAARYRVEVAFSQETLADAACEQTIPTDMFAPPNWIGDAVRRLGYDSVNDLVRSVRQRTGCQEVALLVHVNKRATSYNLTFSDGIHGDFHAERAVMFSRYRDGRPTCAGSYAHEILHNFGAGELYFPFDTDTRRKTLAASMFPDDVMCRVDYNLRRISVGEYTAYRVGWIDRLDPRHKVFED